MKPLWPYVMPSGDGRMITPRPYFASGPSFAGTPSRNGDIMEASNAFPS
jgi:hypothetical protein